MAYHIKRRIKWNHEVGTAKATLIGGDETIFRWLCRTRTTRVAGTDKAIDRDYWYLYWESEEVGTFMSPVSLKIYIIRFVYGIDNQFLVPSEILREANLWYSEGEWVESFCRTEPNGRIESFEGEYPGEMPSYRRIQVTGEIERKKSSYIEPRRTLRAALAPLLVLPFALAPRKEVPEPPDEECVFVIPVGQV